MMSAKGGGGHCPSLLPYCLRMFCHLCQGQAARQAFLVPKIFILCVMKFIQSVGRSASSQSAIS